VIDEMPTVGLPNLTGYLATVGGAGITMMLYSQALPQIEDVYAHGGALSILSNCTSSSHACSPAPNMRLPITLAPVRSEASRPARAGSVGSAQAFQHPVWRSRSRPRHP
jgi:hypothetical protein